MSAMKPICWGMVSKPLIGLPVAAARACSTWSPPFCGR
jgi:hypothetical protein